jgi:hypothetical protein
MTTETLNPAETGTRPSPDVMRGVIPYVSLGGRAGEAADFYARAFGARDLGRMPMQDRPGAYMHVQVEVNGGTPLTSASSGATNGACSRIRSDCSGRFSNPPRKPDGPNG